MFRCQRLLYFYGCAPNISEAPRLKVCSNSFDVKCVLIVETALSPHRTEHVHHIDITFNLESSCRLLGPSCLFILVCFRRWETYRCLSPVANFKQENIKLLKNKEIIFLLFCIIDFFCYFILLKFELI